MKLFLFNQILNEFYKDKKYSFYFLFFFSIIAGLFEYMGLILIFQFVLFLSNPLGKYCSDILAFFENNLNISDFSKVTFILGVAIACVYILKNIYMFIFTKFSNNLLQDLSLRMISKSVKNMLFQDYLKICETTKEDRIATISKIDFVIWQYCYKVVNLVTNFSIIVILVACLFLKFTLSAIFATVFLSILSLIEYKYLKNNSIYQNKNFSPAFNALNEGVIKTINSTKEIKLSAKQDYFIEKIMKNAKVYSDLYKDKNFFNVFHIYFTEISIMLTFVLVLGVLFCTTNFDNQLLLTYISTMCVIILRLTPVINRTQSCLYSINSHSNLAKEILEFNNKFKDNINFVLDKELLPFKESIELKGVNFSYKNNATGLKNINLKINKGDFIGIVGKSGCYKTTLASIVSGLIQPDNGEIVIDSKALIKKDIQKWQNNIAFLSQDYSFLFDDLSEVNSKYLKSLGLDNLNLNFEENSFGQKHRIALANVLSQEKKVLILDEISSSIDVISEEKINNILKDLKGEKTIISIAHRLQILKYCDKIIYMDEGKIIDIDTFKVLSEKYAEFKKIVELSSFEIN